VSVLHGRRLRDLVVPTRTLRHLLFSDAETHAKRSKNQTEDGDEDREGGPEAEAGEDVCETAALGRQCAQTVQGDELIDARRRSSVVVRSYL